MLYGLWKRAESWVHAIWNQLKNRGQVSPKLVIQNVLIRTDLRVVDFFQARPVVCRSAGGLCRGFGGNSNYSAPGDPRSLLPQAGVVINDGPL